MQCARLDIVVLQDTNVKTEDVCLVVGSTDSGEEVVLICLGVVWEHIIEHRSDQFIGGGKRTERVLAMTNMVISRVVETVLAAILVGASRAFERKSIGTQAAPVTIKCLGLGLESLLQRTGVLRPSSGIGRGQLICQLYEEGSLNAV